MSEFKTAAENPNGLHQRYRVEKLDGENDPNAVYFVLRLDKGGDDPLWTQMCRNAVYAIGVQMLTANHLPQLGREMMRLANKHEHAPTATGEA